MTKINITYEDRNFFHPLPTARMVEVAKAILNKFRWEVGMPVEKLTKDEAKQLIAKGIRKCKRDKVRLFSTEVDEFNKELQLNSK